MTSAISYSSIDETYPVAGQDNNSQGFRDNFNYIKNGLSQAASEITALQDATEGLNLTAVTGGSDFNGRIIKNATLDYTYNKATTWASTDTSIDVENGGAYQVFPISTVKTLQFANWPDSGVESRIRIDLYASDGVSRAVTIQVAVGSVKFDDSGEIAAGISANSAVVTLEADSTLHTILEAWTINGGTTVYLKYLGKFSS